MELPLPASPSPLISSSSSSSSSSSTSMTLYEMNISNASLLSCDEQCARMSYANPTMSYASDAASNDQYQHQCIGVQYIDEQVRSLKKRKLAASASILQEDQAHVPTIHSMYSPHELYKMGNQHCHCDNQELTTSIKDDREEAGINQEEELVACTTPPHVNQCTTCIYDHVDCSIREVNNNEEPLHAQLTSASIGDTQHNGYGIELMCECSILRRGPPPAPRKPKAKPRILKSDHLNFLIPKASDLELFFSSTSAPHTNIYKQANHDA